MGEKTILVIEDNDLNIELVKAILQIADYRVLVAEDAESGIALSREYGPDLILMDIQLPGMDGLTATQTIKNDEALRDIPVVALTSYAMQGDEEKAIQAGCAGYITKPFSTTEFLDTVRLFLK